MSCTRLKSFGYNQLCNLLWSGPPKTRKNPIYYITLFIDAHKYKDTSNSEHLTKFSCLFPFGPRSVGLIEKGRRCIIHMLSFHSAIKCIIGKKNDNYLKLILKLKSLFQLFCEVGPYRGPSSKENNKTFVWKIMTNINFTNACQTKPQLFEITPHKLKSKS